MRFLRYLSLLFAIAGLAVLLAKAVYIFRSGAVIPSEVISPASLSSLGKKIKTAPLAIFSEGDRGGGAGTGLNAVEGLIRNSFNGAVSSPLGVSLFPWVVANDFTPGFSSVARGGFIHHYSTVLFPYRQIFLDKNYSLLVTTQYGPISILPLLLMRGVPYIYYPLSSLLLLAVCFGILWLVLQGIKVKNPLLIIGVLILLVSLDLNQLAFKFNPGFSFYRYFPASVILTLFLLTLEKHWHMTYLVIAVAMALLNSLQFNLLLLLIGVTSACAVYVSGNKDERRFLSLLAGIALVIGLQKLVVYQGKSALDVPSFASVGVGRTSVKYSLLVFLFPLVSIGLKYVKEKRMRFGPSEIFSYVAYGGFSVYAISFYGSPQHYVGFLFCALLPISIILLTNLGPMRVDGPPTSKYLWLYFVISVCALFAPSIFKHLISWPRPESSGLVGIYAPRPFGGILSFSMANRLDVMSQEFSEILKDNHVTSKEVYFFSKDKVFLELYDNVNYLPKSYDPFLNFPDNPETVIFNQAKADGIKYVMSDSYENLGRTREYLEFSLDSSIGYKGEVTAYLALVNKIILFTSSSRLKPVDCRARWCLYRVIS